MRWPWSPPRPEPDTEALAQAARRLEIRRRVEALAEEIQRLAVELERHKRNNRHGGTKPWPT